MCAKDSIYLGMGNYSDPFYHEFSLLTEELSAPIFLTPTPPHAFRSVQVQTNEKLQILSFDCATRTMFLWSWDWERNLVEWKVGEKVQMRYPRTNSFTLSVGKEMFWLDIDKPEVNSFNVETYQRQWRSLRLGEVD